jgi:hypothetical protein
MYRPLLHSVFLSVLVLTTVRAQAADPLPAEEKGTYLGVLFAAVPEIVYDQVPDLKRNHGVAVTHVLPKSPAARAGLQRNDIVLQYNSIKVRDCVHFARLIRDDKVDKKVKLVFMRGGKEMTTEATLALGPVLRIVPAAKSAASDTEVAHGTAKSTPPPKVSVTATPLGDNNMKLTVEYYPEGSGKLKTVVCSGSPKEIDSEVQKLPDRVQRLTRNALVRIRALELQKTVTPSPPAKK